MVRINQLIAERQSLFRRAAEGFLPEEDLARLKQLPAEIAGAWDAYRRAGHPEAVQPVDYDWERPRRGRKPKHLQDQAA